jgi:hypothetical protein
MHDTDGNATEGWARRIWGQARRAAWANRWPAVGLQVFGAAVLVSYFALPATASFWEQVAAWKIQYGVGFAIVSTALAAGLIPFCAQGLQRGQKPDYRWRSLAFVLIYWGLKGVQVDILYRCQAWAWGDQATLGVVVGKVLIDQLVYVPLIAVPDMTFAYAWKAHDYSWSDLRRTVSWRWYLDRSMPMMVMNWLIWIPAVAMIYVLPTALQLPVQNLVLCFWSLVLLVITVPSPEAATTA